MAKKRAKAKHSTALAVRHNASAPASNQALAMIERFATNPDFDVAKMKALMEMREREMGRVAEQAFHRAMAETQKEMRPVAKDADNQQTRSRYATYTALDAALRPIYSAHGFGLSFNTGDAGKPDTVRVICDVSHEGGHSKPYVLDMPADGKGAKGGDVMTKTHATGSAVSYGMRYLLKMIFNVAIGEFDDDGNKAGAKVAPKRPAPREEPPIDAEPVRSEPISQTITNEQRKRLTDIASRKGYPAAEVTLWLKKRFGVSGTAGIKQSDYKAVCAELEASGKQLQIPGDGQ